MIKYFTLIHSLTGYTFGKWYSYEEAECYRESLDDWTYWSVESQSI